MSFMSNFTFPQYNNCRFILLLLGFLVQCNVGKPEIIFPDNASKNNIKLKKYYAEKFSKTASIEIKINFGVEIGKYQLRVLLLNIF